MRLGSFIVSGGSDSPKGVMFQGSEVSFVGVWACVVKGSGASFCPQPETER